MFTGLRSRRAGVDHSIVIIIVLLIIVLVQGYFLFMKKPTVTPLALKKAPVKETPIKKPVMPQKEQLKPSAKPVTTQGYMTVVIDDWGYNRSHCQNLRSISVPVGVAILPGLTYSRDVIACAHEAGKEPMLHLPMQPYSAKEAYDSEYLLTIDMSPAQARKKLLFILGEMQGVVGVNNHTGSKATESVPLMKVVLAEIRKKKLFFLDSLTSEKSVGQAVADEMGFPIGRRTVFLDNINTREAVEAEFLRAVKIAKKDGFALVIGHDRALSLKIIEEQTNKWKQEGIAFLSVSDYIRRYDNSRN